MEWGFLFLILFSSLYKAKEMVKEIGLVHKNRIEIFFFTLLLILFGSIFFPFSIYDEYIEPFLMLLNILAGVQLVRTHPTLHKLCWAIFIVALISTISERAFSHTISADIASRIRLFLYFFFYAVVTVQLILQVWQSKEINARGMMALMSGYICLGLFGFFIFLFIEVYQPGSIKGIDINQRFADEVMYFSYITLLTIGYGDILPVTPLAQRTSVLLGLIGQFYMVILVAVVLDKFKNSRKKKDLVDL